MTAAPPDPNGAPGAKVTLPDGRVIDQYVQWANEDLAVFDKVTGSILYGPVLGNTLWSAFGGPCENDNDGDPMVQYDACLSLDSHLGQEEEQETSNEELLPEVIVTS